MASPGEEERPDFESHEDEGGPVKSFLEHLEDLRWVLIKGVVAVGVLMVVCLAGADFVISILKWPLLRADKYRQQAPTELVMTIAGTNVLNISHPDTNFFNQLGFTNTTRLGMELVPKLIGTDYVLTVQLYTNEARLAQAKPRGTLLRTLSPVGGFWVAFQVALYGGIVLGAPYLIYIIGQFVLPALKYKEKKYILRGFAIGTSLFMSGVAFCYFCLMPVALRASFRYSEILGFSADEWRAEDYISFVCKFMLGMGLGFELPVVILTLVKIGILNATRLAAMRRYMIVINLFLGAVLTTPEVVTQVLMFVPLQGLYELSVWIARYWELDERGKARARRNLVIVMLLVAALAWTAWYFTEHPEPVLQLWRQMRGR